MDRSIIAPYKAEEKELSEKLYKKLQGLAFLHPMNDELQKLLSWDMFLKPNHNAFFQIFNYLYRLLDPVEYRKRFFWPITDKRAEANFRATTIEYLKFLNEKHNLQWANIQSYVVVKPSGMKFITFMLDFVGLVIQQLIKQREKSLENDADIQNHKSLDIRRMHRYNKFIKEFAAAYIHAVIELCNDVRDQTKKLKEIFNEISKATKLSVNELLDDKFSMDFETSNHDLIMHKFMDPAEQITLVEKPLNELSIALENFQTKEAAAQNYNKDALKRALCTIDELYPGMLTNGNEISTKPGGTFTTAGNQMVPMNTLLQAFNCISEMVKEELQIHDNYDVSNAFVTTELQTLKIEIDQVNAQITNLQKKLNAKAKQNDKNSQQTVCHTPLRDQLAQQRAQVPNTLFYKYLSTPPIKFEFLNNTRNIPNLRMPLQGDCLTKPFESFKSMLAPPLLRSGRKNRLNESIADSNLNKSKRVGALELLRTINKDKSKVKPMSEHNLSFCGAQWRQRQGILSVDLNLTAPVTPVRASYTALMSPLNCLNLNDSKGIDRLTSYEANNGNNSGNNTSLIFAKNSAVMKVLDASMNVQNLSTSPSGRLDPLVTLNEIELPKLKLNDETIQQSLEEQQDEQKENKPLELFKETCFNSLDELLNTSDTVLNDVIL